MPFNKGEYDKEYNKANVTRKFIPFNKNNPEDVVLLEWLNKRDNVTEYVKKLICADMKTKALPYNVIEVIDIDDGSEGHRFDKYCPSCNVGFGWFMPPKFCPKCGQQIDIEHGTQIDTKIIDNRTKKWDS